MKKILLSAFSALFLSIPAIYGQTTATNFTANDCAGNSHTLFTELDAGKVVVLTWVMPCGACISVAGAVSNKVQTYASTNPGRVKFYLVDDYADTPCGTITGWANTNSITTSAVFSNAAIKMSDYGTPGMQKTIVLGGPNHTVFYNVVGAVSASALQSAIDNALAATTGISENHNLNMGLSLFPNPAVNYSKVNYTLNKASNVSLDILNLLGEKINSISLGTQSAGKQEYQVSFEAMKEGIYFIKLNAGDASQTAKCIVTH